MNYKKIDQYMEEHGFLNADKYKIHEYIRAENRTRSHEWQFVNGYLTRHNLILECRNRSEAIISRFILGIQENFQ